MNIELGSYSVFADNAMPCPKGHRMFLENVTVGDALQEIYRKNPKALNKIAEIAKDAVSDKIDMGEAFEKITQISPELSRALKSDSRLIVTVAWLYLLLELIAGMTGNIDKTIKNTKSIISELTPAVSKHEPIIDKIAARKKAKSVVGKTVTKEQVRKQKQTTKKNKVKKAKKNKKLRRLQSMDK